MQILFFNAPHGESAAVLGALRLKRPPEQRLNYVINSIVRVPNAQMGAALSSQRRERLCPVSAPEDATFRRDRHRVRAITRCQLGEDALHVRLDRLF